ncbi:MAG: rhodanese-like domain-containing protein [Sulfuricaulis sp.]
MSHIVIALRKSLCNFLGLIFIALPAMALAGPQTPPSIPGVTVVTAEKAKAMQDKGVLIVDARVANEYVEEHIKGAINVPYKEESAKSVNFDSRKDKFDLSKLPANKNTAIIFYCNAGECWKSYKASTMAVRAGHKNVYWLRGGIPEWKAKGLPVE